MNISLLSDQKVNDDKSGFLSHVDDVVEFQSLSDMGDLLVNFHIAPGVFHDNQKNHEHFKSIDFICFDFDTGEHSSKSVHDTLNSQLNVKCDHIIAASKNHNIDKNDGRGLIERFHVFIPLSKPITSVESYKQLCKRFATMARWSVDHNCIKPSQYFYKHKSILFITDNIGRLNTDLFLLLVDYNTSKSQNRIQKTIVNNNGDSVAAFKNSHWYSHFTNGTFTSDGERYAMSCRLIGVMKKYGLSQEEILSIFDEHSSYGKSFNRNSIIRRVKQFK